MTDNQWLLWLLSRPACAKVNQAMQKLTVVNYNTGEQNRDMTAGRQTRDWKDTLTVLQYLLERIPFSLDKVFPLECMPTPLSMLMKQWQSGT